MTVFRHEAVQIDDERDLCWRAISDACNHRPRRTVPDEDEVVQIFALQHVDDVSDVHIDVIAEFLRAEVPSSTGPLLSRMVKWAMLAYGYHDRR